MRAVIALALRRWAASGWLWPVVVCGGFVAAMAWVVVLGIERHNARYAEYLADCMEHRPRYECMLLWRRSRPPDNDIVLVPVPMR
jgi:membrane protein YdbS with pleckstrin-like domain